MPYNKNRMVPTSNYCFFFLLALVPEKYYPAVSLYMQGKVKWNFGPKFKHPPEGYKSPGNLIMPMSEAAQRRHLLENIAIDPFVTEAV